MQDYKLALLAKQVELERRLLPNSLIRSGIEIEHQSDEADNIVSRQQRELSLEEISRSQGTLSRIKAALQRIADGSFGVCVACEEQISEKRLRALPWADRCLKCQELLDMDSKQTVQVGLDAEFD